MQLFSGLRPTHLLVGLQSKAACLVSLCAIAQMGVLEWYFNVRFTGITGSRSLLANRDTGRRLTDWPHRITNRRQLLRPDAHISVWRDSSVVQSDYRFGRYLTKKDKI